MNNTDNVKLKPSFHSLLQSKKLISGEIFKEPCLDILLTDLEQSSFSLLLPEIQSIANNKAPDLPKLQGSTKLKQNFKLKVGALSVGCAERKNFTKTSNRSKASVQFLLGQLSFSILQNNFQHRAKLIALNSNNKATHLKTSSYLFNMRTLPNKALPEPLQKLNKNEVYKKNKVFFNVTSFFASLLFAEQTIHKFLLQVLQAPTNIYNSVQKIRPILCLVKVGDYVHCGDKIGYSSETPIIISESGKILKISQTQITIQKMQPVLFYSQAEIHVESNEWVKRGTPILTLAHQTLVTGDIVQGIPRIEQLFEASTSAPAALQDLSEHSENDSQSNLDDYLKSQHTESKAFTKKLLPPSSSFTQIRNGDIFSLNLEKSSASTENLYTGEGKALNKNSTAHLRQSETPTEEKPMLLYKTLQSQVRETFRKKWDQLPLPVAVRQSLEEIQQIIVESIQKVYLSQGVLIADKHIEIIVRQMTSKAQIFDGGNTGLLIDEILSLQQIENANISTPGQKALYLPVVMGLTRAALSSDSFVSAASFQETTRVLSRDAVAGKTDFLRGLKEKVIIGDLIDAGTGLDVFYVYSLFSKKVFENKFREILNRKITHKTLKKLVLTVAK